MEQRLGRAVYRIHSALNGLFSWLHLEGELDGPRRDSAIRLRWRDVDLDGAIESLRALMNHSRIDTTQVYLRALNKSKAMEAVRDLSWGLAFQPQAVEAHTGFEPVPPP